MKVAQEITDKFAIGLSLLCAVHCLLLPVILILLPNLASLNLQNETFHLWMIIAVVPTSAYALTMGCKVHKQYKLVSVGLLGLGLLFIAAFFGHDLAGEVGEKALTLLGACLVVIAHAANFQKCKAEEKCPCTKAH